MKSALAGQFLRPWFVCLPLVCCWRGHIRWNCAGLWILPFVWLGFTSIPLFWVSFCCTDLQEHTTEIRKSCWIGLEE